MVWPNLSLYPMVWWELNYPALKPENMSQTRTLLQLYPPPAAGHTGQTELKGLYASMNLRQGLAEDDPLVYANFLSSLDGRIALDDGKGNSATPKELTSPEDFRLFLELLSQADCLITHGAYLRALEDGRLGNVLQTGVDQRSQDLAALRTARGLKPQPDIAIVSASLDFPMPESLARHGQHGMIFTGERADPLRCAAWEQKGYEVLRAGKDSMVEGAPLVDQLTQRGYRSIYLVAGPHILDTVLRAGRLSRLFQTIHHELLGGRHFHTMIPGETLQGAGRMKLESLYYHAATTNRSGQWFAQFTPLSIAQEATA